MPQNPTLTLPEKEEVKEKIVGIRTANYLDTIKIWTKFKESVMISSGINPSLFDDMYGVKWVESFVERDTLFIATISGRIVGAIGLMPEQFLPYLNPHKGGPIYYCVSLFFTHRKFSEHGLDKLLVSKASNLAKEQNIPLVFGPTHGSALQDSSELFRMFNVKPLDGRFMLDWGEQQDGRPESVQTT